MSHPLRKIGTQRGAQQRTWWYRVEKQFNRILALCRGRGVATDSTRELESKPRKSANERLFSLELPPRLMS